MINTHFCTCSFILVDKVFKKLTVFCFLCSIFQFTGTIPPPDHIVVLKALPPYSTKYEDTNDYHWPLLSTKDDTAYVNAEKKALAVPDTRGPFGFGDAVQLKDNKVKNTNCNLIVQSLAGKLKGNILSRYLLTF